MRCVPLPIAAVPQCTASTCLSDTSHPLLLSCLQFDWRDAEMITLQPGVLQCQGSGMGASICSFLTEALSCMQVGVYWGG